MLLWYCNITGKYKELALIWHQNDLNCLKKGELQHFLESDAEVVATHIVWSVRYSNIFPEAIFGAKNLEKLLWSYLIDIYARGGGDLRPGQIDVFILGDFAWNNPNSIGKILAYRNTRSKGKCKESGIINLPALVVRKNM
jgi:hypothetical protein